MCIVHVDNSLETQTIKFLQSWELTLQLSLWGAADAVLPQNCCIVHESEAQLGLKVKVLPAASSHGGVEYIWYIKRHTQSHVGLDQVQHL